MNEAVRNKIEHFLNSFDLAVINAHGGQIDYAGPFKLGKADYSDAEWFQRAIQSEFFISDVFSAYPY